MRKIFLHSVILIVLLFTAVSFSQPRIDYDSPSVSDWIKNPLSSQSSLGLIDPSRLDVNHSFSFGSSFAGGQSLHQSLYTTQFTYKLSNPVTLNFLLGVQNLQGNNIPGLGSQNAVLGGFSLDYRPTKNLHFRVAMQNLPDGAWYSSPGSMNSQRSLFGDRYIKMLDDKPVNDPLYDDLNGIIRP